MKKYLFFTLIAALFTGCTTALTEPPEWAGQTQNVDAVYPAAQYIAQKGTGAEREKAQVNALAAISRYFESEVKSQVSSEQVITQQNGVDEEYLRVEERGVITSETSLFAVRYSENWFNKTEKQWETVAYIDRDEAWTIFEPRLRQKTTPFMTAFRMAEAERDALRQFILFSILQDTELVTMLDFAQVLHPRKAQAFDGVREAYSECSNRAEAAKTRATIAVICTGDFENNVYNALASSLSSHGFALARNEGEATHRAQAVVNENEQKLSAGTFFAPSIAVTLSGGSDVIFTYNKAISRAGANDPIVAKRRAYVALNKAIQEDFWNDLVQDNAKELK